MSDLIRRQDALKICDKYNGQGWVWSMIRKEVEELPSVEPKTGHWIFIEENKYGIKVKCSECGAEVYYAGDKCSRCKSKMVEPQESEG